MKEQIELCWYCGSVPRETTVHKLSTPWVRLECCTAGQSSIHRDMTVNSWNRVQTALELQRTLERLDIPVQPFLDLRDRLDSYIRGAE